MMGSHPGRRTGPSLIFWPRPVAGPLLREQSNWSQHCKATLEKCCWMIVTAADLENPQAISRTLERRFGNTTPAVVIRQRFNERVRAPGEKLGVFAAELRYLAQRGFPDFDDATRLVLTKEAFIRGLLPPPLRQQVRLADPQTLEEALNKALAVEEILIEGFESFPQPQPTQTPRSAPPSRSSGRPPAAPGGRDDRICWRCNQRGHTQWVCTVPDSALNAPESGNGQGSA